LLAIWFGFIPDYRGIQTAEKFVSNNGGDSIVVAAGIAVQSQWHTPLDDLPGDGGRGKAQVSDDQMPEYGLDGQDQTNPEVAVAAMASRIERIQDACSGCQGKDLLVAAALAQNGSGISQDMIEKAPRNDDGSVRWHVFFKRNYSFHSVSHPSAFAREKFTGLQFDVQLMLLLFLNDLRELHSRGWDLPYELTLEDLNEIEDEYVSRWDFYDK
jgi:hypothetical protein